MTLQPHFWAYTQRKHNLKEYMHPNVHFSTVYYSQDMEAVSMSINRGVDKEDGVHMYI